MKMTHKILFVLTPAFSPTSGGVQNTTFKLGREFTKRGHQVSYFSYAPSGHVKVEYGNLFHADESGASENKGNNEKLSSLICSIQPDIVINQMPYEKGIQQAIQTARNSMNFLVLGCLRNSLFSVVNNLETYAQKSLPKKLRFLSKSKWTQRVLLKRHQKRHAASLEGILQNHDYFVFLVPTNADEMEYFLPGFDRSKTFAIPNSIPSLTHDFSKKEKVILHVGRLNFSQKRSDLLVPFWEKIHKQLPDWSFEVVGYGEYQDKIESEIKKKKLPRVKVLGKQNPIDFYLRAQIFMMPSAYEGFPNTLLEAQSYGCVPFCFDSYPAVRWIVKDKEDAFLIKPFDLDDMVQQMVVIAQNDELLRQHAYSALNNAERFVVNKVVDLWEEKFKEICNKS
jgi:glycosyltransferase involved in cell wall biosynthesis